MKLLKAMGISLLYMLAGLLVILILGSIMTLCYNYIEALIILVLLGGFVGITLTIYDDLE